MRASSAAAGSRAHLARCLNVRRVQMLLPSTTTTTTTTRASTTSNGASTSHPSPAETARTVVHLASEGTLCTITDAGSPLGAPVAYTLDKEDGQPVMHVLLGSPEEANQRRELEEQRQHQQAQEAAANEAAAALQAEAIRIAYEAQQQQQQQQLQLAVSENKRLLDEQNKQRLLLDERDEALRAVAARLAQDKTEESDRRRHDAEMMAVMERTRAEASMSIERARQDTAGASIVDDSTTPLTHKTS